MQPRLTRRAKKSKTTTCCLVRTEVVAGVVATQYFLTIDWFFSVLLFI